MKIKDDKKYYIEAVVILYSHKVKKETLEKWNKTMGKNLNDPTFFIFENEKKIKIQIELKKVLGETKNINKILKYGEILITSITMSLNISSIGTIWFAPYLSPLKIWLREQDSTEATHPQHYIPMEKWHKNDNKELTLRHINNAMMIFTTILGLDDYYFKRYIGGMSLLTVYNFNYNFAEEIFVNFYKTIERFVALEIKKNNKLPGLKDIQDVYESLGLDKDEHLEEIQDIYILRSTTAMHSIGQDRKITLENSLKIKTLLDFLLHKELFKRVSIKEEDKDGHK